jgi:hypothetical protein
MITEHVLHVVLFNDDKGKSDSTAPTMQDDRYLAVWLPAVLAKVNQKYFFTYSTEL